MARERLFPDGHRMPTTASDPYPTPPMRTEAEPTIGDLLRRGRELCAELAEEATSERRRIWAILWTSNEADDAAAGLPPVEEMSPLPQTFDEALLLCSRMDRPGVAYQIVVLPEDESAVGPLPEEIAAPPSRIERGFVSGETVEEAIAAAGPARAVQQAPDDAAFAVGDLEAERDAARERAEQTEREYANLAEVADIRQRVLDNVRRALRTPDGAGIEAHAEATWRERDAALARLAALDAQPALPTTPWADFAPGEKAAWIRAAEAVASAVRKGESLPDLRALIETWKDRAEHYGDRGTESMCSGKTDAANMQIGMAGGLSHCARFKARRRAYLGSKVPRSRCLCFWIERTRRGGCAEAMTDPDGNRHCAAYLDSQKCAERDAAGIPDDYPF